MRQPRSLVPALAVVLFATACNTGDAGVAAPATTRAPGPDAPATEASAPAGARCEAVLELVAAALQPAESPKEAHAKYSELGVHYAAVAGELDDDAAAVAYRLSAAATEAAEIIRTMITDGEAATADAFLDSAPKAHIDEAFASDPLLGLPEDALADLDARCATALVADQHTLLAVRTVERDLREAAIALETYYTEHHEYRPEGQRHEPDPAVTLIYGSRPGDQSYCLEAIHDDLLGGEEIAAIYDSARGGILYRERCPEVTAG